MINLKTAMALGLRVAPVNVRLQGWLPRGLFLQLSLYPLLNGTGNFCEGTGNLVQEQGIFRRMRSPCCARLGQKRDICAAKRYVRFTPDCDRKSRHRQDEVEPAAKQWWLMTEKQILSFKPGPRLE